MEQKFSTLVDMIQNSVKSYPDNRVFGTKSNGVYQWITYRQFGNHIDNFRNALIFLGVKPEDRVAIISSNRVEWAVGAYATYECAATYAPMYESQSVDEWEFILSDNLPTVLIISKPAIYQKLVNIINNTASIKKVILLDGKSEGTISYAEALELGSKNQSNIANVSPQNMATLIYTSGTTGKPKGVMLSHSNIISNINAIHECFKWEPSDVSLSFLPWAHSFGQTVELHGMLSCGAAIGLAERIDTIIENLSEVRPTLLFSVPRIFNKIYDGLKKKMQNESSFKKALFYAGLKNSAELRELKEKGKPTGFTGVMNKIYDKLVFSKVRERLGGNLKYAFSGGAALSKEVAEFIDNLNITVYEGYGLSETSPIMTANYIGNRRIGSVGKPVPGITVLIDKSADSGDPEVGEIINYGPNTMQGYYRQPEETAKVMTIDGGFRTGDLGKFDSDGFLYITGRVKEQYKLENGKYVAPAPLEENLQLSPFILQAMIYGDNKLFNVALIVPDFNSLKEYALEQGIQQTSNDFLVTHAKVRELIEKEIEQYSKDWKGYERPKAFHLLSEEWSVDNGLLTPKLSLKRRNVVKLFETEILGLYSK